MRDSINMYLLYQQSLQIPSGAEKYSTDTARLSLSQLHHRQTDTVGILSSMQSPTVLGQQCCHLLECCAHTDSVARWQRAPLRKRDEPPPAGHHWMLETPMPVSQRTGGRWTGTVLPIQKQLENCMYGYNIIPGMSYPSLY